MQDCTDIQADEQSGDSQTKQENRRGLSGSVLGYYPTEALLLGAAPHPQAEAQESQRLCHAGTLEGLEADPSFPLQKRGG